MRKAKVRRIAGGVDMTAMCDVSFLLLNFFIMTSTTKVPDPVDISIPSSTYKIPVPEKDISILTVGKEGQVFFEAIGQDIKIATLEKMGEQYGISFTPEEKNDSIYFNNRKSTNLAWLRFQKVNELHILLSLFCYF